MSYRIDFWFELASTYSFLAAERIEALAAERNVDVTWRPLLLGAIFKKQGYTTSPFNQYVVKGRYMWRDMERWCDRLGIPLKRPNPFPQNTLRATRVCAGLEGADRIAFTKAVFRAQFSEGAAVEDRAVLTRILRACAIEPEAAMVRAESEGVKARLRAETEQAESIGVFGAPTFGTRDGELFWGNDRLEEALDWTIGKR